MRGFYMKKYKPLAIAIFLTVLAFSTGYYSNRKPENVARSYLASHYSQGTPSYACKQVDFEIIDQQEQTYRANYTCYLITKKRTQKKVNGIIHLEKINHKWRVINDL